MEDNSSTDDEVNDSPLSPKLGGKKLKLNDGSSHDSANGEASGGSNDKEEVIDSGISADKSESTSSDDHLSASGPSNELINAGTSQSMMQAILLNIRQPKRERNYRKRKTPDRDSDTNESSRDSDDFSTEENFQPVSIETGNIISSEEESESDNLQDLFTPLSEGSPSASSSTSSSTSYTNYSFDSDDMVRFQSLDTSEDEGVWSRSNAVIEEEEVSGTPPEVLLKQRPKHNYIILREIINREMGLTFPCGKTTQTDVMFEQKFYGSLHAVYRLKKLHHLHKHSGCVNSINFHPEGHLLASGSDDTNVVVWDWARNRALQTIKTGHKSNVFQSKFLHLNARSQLNIVTCARDGQVRLVQCAPCGGSSGSGAGVARRRLAAHGRAAHKLHVSARAPHEVLSAGEDGLVVLVDVRADRASRLVHVKEQGATVPLYSVAGHPSADHLLLAGRDRYLRVYDRRHPQRPLALYCPKHFVQDIPNRKKLRTSMMHLTCAVYNHDGTQLLGSYNDDDIYLFDAKEDVYEKDNIKEDLEGFRRRYSGHRNTATFKGVAFFGPRSEYVVSGSDCAHVYVWHTESEALVQWLHADYNGVVNCIETHPRFPVMATSGLDKDVKIWIPKSHSDPDYDGMEKVIRENSSTQRSPLFNDFLPTLYNAWRGENRLFTDDDSHDIGGNIDFDGNACTAF